MTNLITLITSFLIYRFYAIKTNYGYIHTSRGRCGGIPSLRSGIL